MKQAAPRHPRRHLYRRTAWGIAAGLLLLPLIAMQFSAEIQWDAADFLLFATLLASVCAAWNLATRKPVGPAFLAATALLLAGTFALVWVNLAVGILGREDDPANWLFAGILAIGILGSAVARFRPAAMAKVLFAMTVMQLLAGVFAIMAGYGTDALFASAFAAIWLAAALLYRRSARQA